MDATLQQLIKVVEKSEEVLVDLHRQLVRIPTVNIGAPDSGNETEVYRLLEQVFTTEGIFSTTLESAPGREDISLLPVLTIGFTDARCVRPLGTDVCGFSPSVPGEKLNAGVRGVDEVISIEDLVIKEKMQVALAYLTLGERAR